MPNDSQFNNVPLEKRKEYTDEFILLGILTFATKYGHDLSKMQIMKILQQFKDKIQEEFDLQAYHQPLVKWKHGDFDQTIYSKLSDLKIAEFVDSKGAEPIEKYTATPYAINIFNKLTMSTGEDEEKLGVVKGLLERIVASEAKKDAGTLRTQNHNREIVYNGEMVKIEDIPIGTVTTPNLDGSNLFLFDNRVSLDWVLYRKIMERKREALIPESEIPQTQEEIYELLGL